MGKNERRTSNTKDKGILKRKTERSKSVISDLVENVLGKMCIITIQSNKQYIITNNTVVVCRILVKMLSFIFVIESDPKKIISK